ncbi:segregation/condensation protein A [Streptomyces sp. SAI-229]|uniref:segregation and condensation protein A n=1 Tax=Streptomyces sp. SAI-229 TaxID=3377731 RepID=UPI003C7B7779
MTSNDAPAPGPRPPRRRTLGRGPGAAPPASGREASEEDVGPSPESGAAGRGEPGPARGTPGATPGTGPPARDFSPAGPVTPEHGDPGPVRGTHAEETDAVPSLGAPSPGDPGTRGTVARVAGPDTLAVGRTVSASGEPESAEASGTGAVGAGRAGAAVPGGSGGGASAAGGSEDGDGRFKVRLVNFEGPFDLLLQLISKHKLDVTEVALSRVTDEFMAYIRALGPDWDLDETTEFLVVAATLLDLKAARLLPAAEVEDEADLALLEARDLLFARLLQYRAYKRIAEIFSRRLEDEGRRHPRTVGLEPHHAELLPEVVISIGAEGFAGLAVKAMQPRPEPQVYVDHIHAPLVSVQEQAGIVVARLKELGEASFRALVEDTDDTLTVVARFLALLELYREKAVALDQEAALGELTVRWTGGDGDAAPTVTDEFDRPPEQPEEERKP